MNRDLYSTYKLGAKIGCGAFSTVYECIEIESGALRAVKVIFQENAKRADPVNEAQILQKLSHRAVPKIYDFFSEDKDENYYIVMERCQGISLKNYLIKNGKMPDLLAVAVAQQMFSAIDHIHSSGIAHLDLKPDNIIINPMTNSIKIIDFGFATINIEECSVFRGSLPYSSPELLMQRPFNALKADVWAAGVIFYEIITGRLPWKYESLESVKSLMKEIFTREIKLSNSEARNYSRLIIDFALNRDPEARATASALLGILNFHQIPKCIRIPVRKKNLKSSSSIFRPKINTIKIGPF